MKLGAGPEALAGFAEGAVGAGRASSGSVYAAARKTVEAQPYNAAAYNVLGLACEARGGFDGAVKAYTDGLDVMTDTEAGETLPSCGRASAVSSVHDWFFDHYKRLLSHVMGLSKRWRA